MWILILFPIIILVIIIIYTAAKQAKTNSATQAPVGEEQATRTNRRRKTQKEGSAPQSKSDIPEISRMLNFLEERLGPPLPEFEVKRFSYYFSGLSFEAHSPGTVASMADEVLHHSGIDSSCVRITTEYRDTNRDESVSTRGLYQSTSHGGGKIHIIIRPEDSSYDTVIAIIMHECAHYASDIFKTRLEDIEKNERLTDLTAIWLGGGKRILRGFFPRSGVHLGYLTEEECKFAIDDISKRRTAAQEAAAQLRKNLSEKCPILDEALNKLNHPLASELLLSTEHQAVYAALMERRANIRKQLLAIKLQIGETSSMHRSEKMCRKLLDEVDHYAQAACRITDALRKYEPLSEIIEGMSESVYRYLSAANVQANNGNSHAQFDMLQFHAAYDVEIMQEEAAALFDRLSAQKTASAQYFIGVCYEKGIYVSVDEEKAIMSWQQAAGFGSDSAELALQRLYIKHRGGQKDASSPPSASTR